MTLKINPGFRRFKAFKELTSIDLFPLVVLCGPNSGGKSSILQNLLLMKQSLPELRLSRSIEERQRALILNGPFVHLGSWKDVVHNHKEDKSITFSWTLDYSPRKSNLEKKRSKRELINQPLQAEISVEIFYSSIDLEDKKGYGTKIPLVKRFKYQDLTRDFSLLLKSEKNDPNFTFKLRIEGANLLDSIPFGIFERSIEERTDESLEQTLINLQKIPLTHFEIKDVNVLFEGIFPRYITIKQQEPSMLEFLLQSTLDNNNLNIRKSTSDIINNYRDSLVEVKKSNLGDRFHPLYYHYSESEFSRFNIPRIYPDVSTILLNQYLGGGRTRGFSIVDKVSRLLQKYWSDLRYLGPLREYPKRFYVFDDIGGAEIGVKGEFAAQVLTIQKNQPIDSYFILNQKENREIFSSVNEPSQLRLLDALNHWLNYMKMPSVNPTLLDEHRLHILKVEEETLPDVGFGVSQILPVLIESLRTEIGQTLILEQPEIHLHPLVQTRLADFLLCMAFSGRRFIVETHSERLIQRLCLRLVQNREDFQVRNLVNILFVELSNRELGAKITPVHIDEYGHIKNWPIGFLDESDSVSIMKEALLKQKDSIHGNEDHLEERGK